MGRRVRGIVTETDLIGWYNKCLRGQFSGELAKPLMDALRSGFVSEFPQLESIRTFMEEREYSAMRPTTLWQTGLAGKAGGAFEFGTTEFVLISTAAKTLDTRVYNGGWHNRIHQPQDCVPLYSRVKIIENKSNDNNALRITRLF